VLINLVDNAIKYTPAGGRVGIHARPVDGTGAAAVELTVSDTGVGIPSQDLPRLTERFFRVDKARSRELGGTGLGLAIVKHIVHAHGGRLTIDSVLGQGTNVRVTLPATGDDASVNSS
jgi:two-component system phosphate regulon sensor histidine kinase PhoR